MENFFFIVLTLMAIFLILLVLVQRGRGGGLAGALGGPGGSSAFGAKAGDTFTKITIWAASIWIVTCIIASYWATHRGDVLGTEKASAASAPLSPGGLGPAEGGAVSDEAAPVEGPAGIDPPAGEKPAAEDATNE
jgi:preprotein translocase subunit SecG